jgi:hypothetical protein
MVLAGVDAAGVVVEAGAEAFLSLMPSVMDGWIVAEAGVYNQLHGFFKVH